jgi:phasin family protein
VFEKAIANSQELAELAAKSNVEATEVITARISEGLGEIQAMTKSLNK